MLATCDSSLQKYTWRHNKVLENLADTTHNKAPAQEEPNQVMKFDREGEQPQPVAVNKTRPSRLLKRTRDRQMLADLFEGLRFPAHIAITNYRPDIVFWSDSCKRVHLVELTVP